MLFIAKHFKLLNPGSMTSIKMRIFVTNSVTKLGSFSVLKEFFWVTVSHWKEHRQVLNPVAALERLRISEFGTTWAI